MKEKLLSALKKKNAEISTESSDMDHCLLPEVVEEFMSISDGQVMTTFSWNSLKNRKRRQFCFVKLMLPSCAGGVAIYNETLKFFLCNNMMSIFSTVFPMTSLVLL